METAENLVAEIRRLQRCINDLVSVLALPAIWTGGEPSQIVGTLLETLQGLLGLDLVYARLNGIAGEPPIEILRFTQSPNPGDNPEWVAKALNEWLGDDPQKWPSGIRKPFGNGDLSVAPIRLGLQGEVGLIVTGSQRADFPQQTETLLLNVVANQAVVGLQEARLLREQKRATAELDQRVAQRTAELAAANEKLNMEVADRKLAVEKLRLEESELKRSQARNAAILNSALDCIVTIDHESRITEFNPAAERTFGYYREQVLGRPLADVIIPPPLREQHRRGFARHLATGEEHVLGRRMELTAVRQDGTEFPVELAITRIPLEGPPSFTGYLRDITERRQTEKNLREAHAHVARNEARWRSVFENSAIGVALADLDCRFIATNPVFEKMVGYTGEELHQLTFLEITHEKDVEKNRRLVHELLEGKRRQFQIEKQLRHKDGKLAWVRNNVSIVPGSELVPRFLMALSEDITERKLAEEALAASECELRSIINTIPTTAWSTLPDGHCDYLNHRWLNYAGLSTEQAQGWRWLDTIHPDDVKQLAGCWHGCLTSGTPLDSEARMRRFDGTYRWFLFRANPLQNEAGTIVKWYGANVDIEERKQAEEKLQRSEAFLAEGQRLSRTGNFSWRMGANEVTWSDELYRIFGVAPDAPVTLEMIRAGIHPDDVPTLNDLIARGQGNVTDVDYTFRLLMPNQPAKHLHLVAHATRGQNGELEYVGTVQDVTERRLYEEELSQLRAELAHVARVSSLGALSASIAHEVNQPLAAVVTNAEASLRWLDHATPHLQEAREAIHRIIRNANRGSEVIGRIRGLLKKGEPTSVHLSINETVKEIVGLAQFELHGTDLQLDLASQLPHISADRVQLQQVLLNLMLNAIDAMKPVTDRPHVLRVITKPHKDDDVLVAVRDSGVGLPPDSIERLFETFYTTKSQGLGMGLSISRSIIENLGGRLWAEPNDGPGATFQFVLPSVEKIIA